MAQQSKSQFGYRRHTDQDQIGADAAIVCWLSQLRHKACVFSYTELISIPKLQESGNIRGRWPTGSLPEGTKSVL